MGRNEKVLTIGSPERLKIMCNDNIHRFAPELREEKNLVKMEISG